MFFCLKKRLKARINAVVKFRLIFANKIKQEEEGENDCEGTELNNNNIDQDEQKLYAQNNIDINLLNNLNDSPVKKELISMSLISKINKLEEKVSSF